MLASCVLPFGVGFPVDGPTRAARAEPGSPDTVEFEIEASPRDARSDGEVGFRVQPPGGTAGTLSQVLGTGVLDGVGAGGVLAWTFSRLLLPAFVLSLGMAKAAKSRPQNGTTPASDGTLREAIADAIASHPGVHFRELCRLLGRQNGVVQYHLRVLERQDHQVVSHPDGRYVRYFPRTPLFETALAKNVVGMLHRDSAGTIVQELYAACQPLSRKTLANAVGISRQGVTWNCQKLARLGVIRSTTGNRERVYALSPPARAFLDHALGDLVTMT